MPEEEKQKEEVKKEEKAEQPKKPEKVEQPEKSEKPAQAEKPKEVQKEKPTSDSEKKKTGKKISQMTLQEVEAGLKMAQEKMGGFQSDFARDLLARKKELA